MSHFKFYQQLCRKNNELATRFHNSEKSTGPVYTKLNSNNLMFLSNLSLYIE